MHDRVYVTTGSTSGLGRAVATALVAEGARVVVSSRTAADVASVAQELGDGAVGVTADITDPATPRRLADAAEEAFGRLDGAFVSHGGPPASSALGLDVEGLADGLDVATVGPIRLLHHLAGRVGSGASLVVLTSTSSVEPIAGIAASNVARPGVWAYAKSLADEVGPDGIRVNALLPGRFATDRLAELVETRAREEGRSVDEQWAAQAESIPLRRIGDPAELAAVAVFLLSPMSGYVTGTAVRVDGGAVRGL
nr:SDR family oxidoreductase [Salsipaludibacter albus]